MLGGLAVRNLESTDDTDYNVREQVQRLQHERLSTYSGSGLALTPRPSRHAIWYSHQFIEFWLFPAGLDYGSVYAWLAIWWHMTANAQTKTQSI